MDYELERLLKDDSIPARHRLVVALILKLIKTVFWGSLGAGILFGESWLLAIAFGMTVGLILFGTLCMVIQDIIKDPSQQPNKKKLGFWANFTNEISMKALWLIITISVTLMWQLIPDIDGNGIIEIINSFIEQKKLNND